MNYEDCREFVEELRLSGQYRKKSASLGLVILEPSCAENWPTVLSQFARCTPLVPLVAHKDTAEESVVAEMVMAIGSGKWPFLILEKDPDSLLLKVLQDLHTTNTLTLPESSSGSEVTIQLDNSRVVVVVRRRIVEEKISYPYFYSLFGPVITCN